MTGGILKIEAADIAEYLQCPMRYKLNGMKVIDPTPKPKPVLDLHSYAQDALTECIKAMLKRHAFDGEAPSLGSVTRLWNDAWKYIYERFGRTDDVTKLYLKLTFKLQEHYHKHVNRTDQYKRVPLMYDYKFILNYDNTDIIGRVDFGFFTKTKHSEHVDLGFMGGDITSKIKDTIRTDYNVLVSVYKFREDFGLPCHDVLYYTPHSMRWLKVNIPYSTEQLHGIIYDVCKVLQTRAAYRNPGLYCKSCPYNGNLMCEF